MGDEAMYILNLGDVLLRHLDQLGGLHVRGQAGRAVLWRRCGVLILISVFLKEKGRNKNKSSNQNIKKVVMGMAIQKHSIYN